MSLFLYVLSLVIIFSFPVKSVEEKGEDFSHKKIVGNFYKKSLVLERGQNDFYEISKKILGYKKEILFIPKKEDWTRKLEPLILGLGLNPATLKRSLERPMTPSSLSLWNEFQHRLKGFSLSRESTSSLYKAMDPSRKIIEDPDQHIVEARFSGCGIDDEQLVRILHLFNDCPSLRVLDLSKNQLSLQSMKRIIGFIRRSPGIQFVDISSNSFSAQEFSRELSSPMVDESFSDQNLLQKLILTDTLADLEEEGKLSGLFLEWRQNHQAFFDRNFSKMVVDVAALKV